MISFIMVGGIKVSTDHQDVYVHRLSTAQIDRAQALAGVPVVNRAPYSVCPSQSSPQESHGVRGSN